MKEAGGKILAKIDADLEDLVPRFLEKRRKDNAYIKAALARRDYESIRILGQSLKDNGNSYGFEGIAEIGAAMENAAAGRRYDEIEILVDKLKDYLERVQIVYEVCD